MMSACGCGCDVLLLEVDAGPHDRKNAIVSFVSSHTCGEDKVHLLHEVNTDGSLGPQVPCQCLGEACDCGEEDCTCCCEVLWIIPELKAGERKRYQLCLGSASEDAGGVTVDIEDDQKATFRVNGDLFMSYVFKQEGMARPFCYPVYGPGGKIIVREVNIPAKPGIDHEHHKGFWVAQGHVNDGEDNWSEMNDHATTECQELMVLAEGPVCGEIMALNDWMSGRRGAKHKMLEEHTVVRVYNTPDCCRVMDWFINFVALEDKGFFFGDTKEAGTLSVRLKESMEERNGGLIVNSYGAKTEAENWGKRAEWVDYCGPVDGETVGVTIMDHPSNHGFPTHWHVRSYGLFTANQWGIHDFTGDPGQRGDLTVRAGDVLSFRFRVFIHAGDTESAKVAGQYLNFIHPPTVRVVEQ